MKLTDEQYKLLRQLSNILYASCHTKDCKQFTHCPTTCKCKKDRTFKLTNETAFTWYLAEEIQSFRISNIHQSKPEEYKRKTSRVITICNSVFHLSSFHMTPGWRNLFINIAECVKLILDSNRSSYQTNLQHAKDIIKVIPTRIRRFKRTPRSIK